MTGQAQTAITYEYDASGNRILRTASKMITEPSTQRIPLYSHEK